MTNLSKKDGWLNREVLGFGFTSFFSDLSHETATTLLPVFLASIGAPPYALGLMEGIADGAATFAKLLGGRVSDRLNRRKPLALAGYILTGLTQGLYAFVTFWPQALFVRTLGWLGRGWRTPVRDALFHDAVPPEATGRAFGFERTLDTLGAVVSPLLVYFLVAKIGFRPFFLWTWLPGLAAVLCFFFLIREHLPAPDRPVRANIRFRDLPRNFKKFLGIVGLFGLADFSHTILIYWAGILLTPQYGAAAAAKYAILLYAVHNAVYAAASYPMGHLGDRIGKLKVLRLGYAAACLMFLALAFARPTLPFLFAVFVIGGFSVAIQDTVERAIAGDLLTSEIKGTGYGVLAAVNGVGDFLSSSVVGILLSLGSPVLAFGFCFVLGCFGTFGLTFSKTSSR